jgi:hypothetical protein
MTLKEKFMKLIEIPFKDKGVYIDMNKVEECEKIAEDFAIGFADWFHANCYEDQVGYYTASELLEIYKKENEKV